MVKDYYSPKDINFSREQVLWLIEHRHMLREGRWPPEHVETGYSGFSGKAKGHSAPFETSVVCIAEVDDRLDQVTRMEIVTKMEDRLTAAGVEGKLLIAEIDLGKGLWDLSYEARTILNFISGWAQKRMSLSAWRKQYRYRHKPTTESCRGNWARR